MVSEFNGDQTDDPEIFNRAAIAIRYSGYIEKQERELAKFRKLEAETIPQDFDFRTARGLKQEALDKFLRFRPSSIGQASRIEGITPGDIAVLAVFVHRHKGVVR
jgi:tRNA uridine 5-carboxymethylaminomethyl modification enzyme